MEPTHDIDPSHQALARRTAGADRGIAKVIPDRVCARALSSFYFESPTGCHISTYSCGSHGYAQIGWQVTPGAKLCDATTAHRAAWTAVNGQIPAGMTIDHTCRNRRCVNVLHLRMLSNFENARRTRGRDWPVGECVNGHGNEHLHQQRGGKWVCNPCMQAARSRWIAKDAARKARR